MFNKVLAIFGSLAALALAFVACSSSPTRLDSSILVPEYADRQVSDVLVVAVASMQENRILFEDEFTDEFVSRGVTAAPSYEVLGQGVEPSAENIIAALEGSSVDAVLVAHVVTAEVQVHGNPEIIPYASERTWGYQDQSTYERQDLSSVEEEIVLETNLYDLASTDLMWTAKTNSFNPGSTQDLIDQLAAVLMTDLQANGLLD